MQAPPFLRRLFTVVFHYERIVSTMQFQADSVQHALKIWRDDLGLIGVHLLDENQREGIVRAFEEGRWQFMPLEEFQGVWSVSLTLEGGELAILHIIESTLLGPPPNVPGVLSPPVKLP